MNDDLERAMQNLDPGATITDARTKRRSRLTSCR